MASFTYIVYRQKVVAWFDSVYTNTSCQESTFKYTFYREIISWYNLFRKMHTFRNFITFRYNFRQFESIHEISVSFYVQSYLDIDILAPKKKLP